MKHLKTFEEKLQESDSPNQLTIEQKKFLNECVRGHWEQVPETGAIDVYGSFLCENKGISDLKGLVFNSITASFNVEGNKLRSMQGFPKTVGGDFAISNNEFESLEGGPEMVSDDYRASYNKLKTLKGAPNKINGFFTCSFNLLEDLIGAPEMVKKGFYCTQNKLTSLEGLPKDFGLQFYCDLNPVSVETLKRIAGNMKEFKIDYIEAVEGLWKWIPFDDQVLLYRPEFRWIDTEERKKLETLKRFRGFKDLV